MALDQAANFVRETVASAISAGDTTINVADASPFPVPPEGYNIVVWDPANYARPADDPDVEIMRVADVDTTNDTLTVARGQEGTSDVSHPDTSETYVAQTAKMIADIASEKISNPVTETVDANGNDVTNVGALDAAEVGIANLGARAWNNTRFSIPTDTSTQFNLDNITFEDSNVVSVDTSSDSFTTNVSGIFLIYASIQLRGIVGDNRYAIEIKVNSSREGITVTNTGNTDFPTANVTTISQLDENDNITAFVDQSSGDEIVANDEEPTSFITVVKLG